MRLEDQVCTLEQAKRLKELGVLQVSLFAYDPAAGLIGSRTKTNKDEMSLWNVAIAAFTVAELGVMLAENAHKVYFDELIKKWVYRYIPSDFDTQAQCMAALLIRLIESKFIPVEQVNRRLSK